MRDEIIAGLLALAGRIGAEVLLRPPRLACCSTAITELPEYYPTRTEAAIFAAHGASDRARRIGRGCTLIDLGAGDCAKATRLFAAAAPGALRRGRHLGRIPARSVALGAARVPALEIIGIGARFFGLARLAGGLRCRAGRCSSTPARASAISRRPKRSGSCARCARRPNGGGLLIGVDLVKPVDVLEAAYDDALGVTAAFNLNLLRHVNRLHRQRFRCRRRGTTWPASTPRSRASRCTCRREARSPCGGPAAAAASRRGERIHTENSYKYTPDAFAALLERAGFRNLQPWFDTQRWFSVVWAEA